MLHCCRNRFSPVSTREKIVGIHIGEYHASRHSAIIQTLVGSCVAVCLFDPVNHVGGMNHILLPGGADMRRFDSSARYGINAMELLINRIMNLEGNRHRLVAKIFGGAHLLPAISEENGVGKKNIAFVLEFLRNESIRIISRDLAGHASRRLFFLTDTGEVFLKRIQSRYYPNMRLHEKAMLKQVRKEAEKPAKVSFFLRSVK
ncbi:MAG: chemotaxis protein CheD [Desulfobacteraceae bacterium 4572_88]|nr:MAG: chemotaxis protein CheD [Desulfobacteraceae bacterium 4572_88]